MSELKPEAILEYLGYKVEDIKTVDDFKAKFDTEFGRRETLLKDPKFVNEIYGKKVGSIEAKVKANAKKMGVEFTPEEIKDKGVEDILELSFTKIAALNQKAMEDAEKASKGTVDEQVKSWKDKHQALESKFKDTEKLLTNTSTEFDTFKKEAVVAQKTRTVNQFRQAALGKLEFKQDITPLERAGFESVLNEKYVFDLDDAGKPFVANKKGERIPSKKVTGQFMEAEEVLQEELLANKLSKLNKDGGKAAPARQTTGPAASAPAAGGEKTLFIHPRARNAEVAKSTTL